MRLVNFAPHFDATPRLGLLVDEFIVDPSGDFARRVLGPLSGTALPATTDDFIRNPAASESTLKKLGNAAETELSSGSNGRQDGILPRKSVTLFPPVLRPSKVMGAGANYWQAPNAEPSSEARSAGSIRVPGFIKVSSTVIGDGHPVRLPAGVGRFLHEGELAVVIGHPGTRIERENSWSHVIGLTIANDVTAVDLLKSEIGAGGAAAISKNLPTFAPLGPCLATLDEFESLERLRLRIWSSINGELVQDSFTSYMKLDVPGLVAWWSQVGLEPGDVILTGTPQYQSSGKPLKLPEMESELRCLQPGDVVQCGVERIGMLTSPVVGD